jgi:hypothetical protein
VKKNSEARVAMSGMGSVGWKSKEQNIAAPAVLLVEYPYKLRLEVQDPVGGMRALLIVHGEQFWWYSADQKEILTGPVSRLGDALGMPFRAEDLVRAFLARPGVERWIGHPADREERSATLEKDGVTEVLKWSSRLDEPLYWSKVMADRRIQAEFSQYDHRFGVSYPKELRLTGARVNESERMISWVWRDWEPRIPEDKKLFQIPQEQRFGRPIKTLP